MMSEWTGNFDEALQKQKQKKNTPVLIWRRTETGQIRKNKRLVTTGTRAVITGQRTGRANQNPCNFTELDFNVKPSRWRFLTLTRTSPSTVKRKDTRALYGATAATPPLPWGLAGLGEMACCTPPPVIPPPSPVCLESWTLFEETTARSDHIRAVTVKGSRLNLECPPTDGTGRFVSQQGAAVYCGPNPMKYWSLSLQRKTYSPALAPASFFGPSFFPCFVLIQASFTALFYYFF